MKDLTGPGPGREQRVVAELFGVAVRGALLRVAMDLTHGGIEIDHHVRGTGPGACSPRVGQQSCRNSVKLTYPNVNDRKKVPIVEGAITRNGNTVWVAPARSMLT